MATISRVRAIEVVMVFVLNFVMESLIDAIESVLRDCSTMDSLGWSEHNEIRRKICVRLEDRIESYQYTQANMENEEHDEYLAARFMLGREFVTGAIREHIARIAPRTIESMMYPRIEAKRTEIRLKKEQALVDSI